MHFDKQFPPLRHRIIRAGTWIMGEQFAGAALRLASNLTMTRLLVPEMFGIMAIAHVIMMGLVLFSDIGLHQSIVQSRRADEPAYLNTVWTMQVLRGLFLWLTATAIAVGLYVLGQLNWLPAGSVYADPVLPWVVAAVSTTALIGGCASTRLATASRELSLGRLTLIELGSQVAGLLFMIAWAMFDRTIWALVGGALFASTLRAVLSHTSLPGHKNRLHWDRSAAQEVFGLGKWIFLTSILGYLSSNGDRLILGALTDAETMGLYAIALFMVSALQEIFAKLVGKVAYPAVSEVVRERPAALKSVYYKFRWPLDVATLFTTGLLFSAGHLVVEFLYDDRYQTVGHMMEILCIGMFEARFSLAAQCFIAMGKPKLLAPIIFVRVVALFALMPLCFYIWGMEGALWIAGGSALFTIPVTFYLKIKHDLFDLRHELVVLPLLILGVLLGMALTHLVSVF
jgi:O-antigen/teichoic acid export membrane protein